MPTLEITANNPNERLLQIAANALLDGEIIICPTDTIYAFVCCLSNKNGIEKLCKIIGKKPEKANLSIICSELKHISDYTMQFSKNTYKLMNRNLPGPFTFILNANNKVPKLFLTKRKTIGIRVPNHAIPLKLVEMINEPLVTASVHYPDNLEEIITSPFEMEELYKHSISIIINSGKGGKMGSGIVNCTGTEPELIREGEIGLL
ncbi:MAG: threonylcarbamoyl-AMP synthase [Bacteroidetes bacterium]|nr:threonylcarbamoyl-AMP synthase [Bacteroidota bacterium]